MKISISQLNKLVAATVTGFGIACIILPQASLAQSSQELSIPSSYQNNTFDTKQGDGDSIYGPQDGNFNPMSLIHRANFGTLDWQGFSSQNRQQINSEADLFRAKQERLLQQRQQQSTNGQQPSNFDFAFPVYTPGQTPASGN
ncbi:hypothetical protein IQ247_07700 [Plectonema cf. radiosum LEGE 06105]|uniref:Uncharacterized protein n=1 Tax=Plectonema cf. radiosum LEGE 06105 TaxID=945769 RepID=A0A8J7F3J9_9CYAN|nr:hypothetical protein [Plectonema radiosum]MBE9212600.1 hypothetical protein [Plectonema cf. radiosum LEGE 06105]